ncbi:MAG: GIY-YIG nuclease family protein [Microbacteriaceae bacterium]
MSLTLETVLRDEGLNPDEVVVIRHGYVDIHEDSGLPGIHADSTDAEILEYTRNQSASTLSFPAAPPKYWVVFVKEGGDRARLWSVLENRGEQSNDGVRRVFDLVDSRKMFSLRDRLVIGWKAPRSWWMHGYTAAPYALLEIADAKPMPFPGYNWLRLDYSQLQAVVRERRYAAWQTALASVIGIYLITDTRDGRQYVGKADGAENILQRWKAYAANGHGGDVHLKPLDPSSFRFSLLRIFDPATQQAVVDKAESHYKVALDTLVPHGLNGA